MKIDIKELLSKTQEELRRFVICKLAELGYEKDMVFTKDYVFAKGNIPVLLVAHLDTVHKDLPIIFHDENKKALWSPQGIGGDDRCGVYAILKICQELKPYVLFTTDEEIGAVGAEKFAQEINGKLLKKVNFAIEIDRRGFNEAVFYDCGNNEFQEFILSFGFDEEIGSFSDICMLSPKFDFASVNLSAGYYNEHTNYEYIMLDHLEYTICLVKKILQNEGSFKRYEYDEVPKIYKYDKAYWDAYYDSLKMKEVDKKSFFNDGVVNDNTLLMMENDYNNMTEKEWFEKYQFEKPNSIDEICYGDMY